MILNKGDGVKKIVLVVLIIGEFMVINAKDTTISDVLDGYMVAWNKHDIQEIDRFYAKDVIWYDLSQDTTIKGKKNVSKAITDAFMGYVPDMYWGKSGDVFISGNTIVYEWEYGGTFDGIWDGKVIKHKKFKIKGLSTTTINQNGKIVAHKDYYDLFGFKKQLGLIK